MAVGVRFEPSVGHKLSAFLYRRPRLRLLALLGPGLLWLGVIYLGSLAALVVFGFWRLEPFTGGVVRDLTFDTYVQLWEPANRDIIIRTTVMAAAVTTTCAVVAFPLAYYMARFASPRMKTLLYLGVLMPLWSSYMVRVLSWKLILATEGIATWFIDGLQLSGVLRFLLDVPAVGGDSLSTSDIGRFLVFVYIWLPYMILPVHAALERVPESYLEASGDLGARPRLTFRRIVVPLAFPGLVAGSIFTFSLTLGDFITPSVIGDSSFYIGNRVWVAMGTESNLPLAAAFSVVPMAIMVLYLVGAKRLGALEAM